MHRLATNRRYKRQTDTTLHKRDRQYTDLHHAETADWLGPQVVRIVVTIVIMNKKAVLSQR